MVKFDEESSICAYDWNLNGVCGIHILLLGGHELAINIIQVAMEFLAIPFNFCISDYGAVPLSISMYGFREPCMINWLYHILSSF